ncbi:MAG: hypothetical protein KKD00_12150 [Gammaproteobacteria bacterium]|nr:hypothetical protein [Gammaproteobacteria bacterium]
MAAGNTQNATHSKSVLIRLAKPVIVLLSLTVVAAVLWQLLPKAAFSSDVSQLGQGRPGLVMLREVGLLGGERVMEHMHTVYPEFEQTMVFLVVHTGNPTGVNFASEHNVRDGGLVFFSAQGEALARLHNAESADMLRQFLNDTMASASN